MILTVLTNCLNLWDFQTLSIYGTAGQLPGPLSAKVASRHRTTQDQVTAEETDGSFCRQDSI